MIGPWHDICLPRSEKQKLSGSLKAPAWKFISCQLKGAAGSGQTQGKGTRDTGHERREWPLGGALPQTKNDEAVIYQKVLRVSNITVFSRPSNHLPAFPPLRGDGGGTL